MAALFAVAALSTGQAQEMTQVSARPIPGGIELDGGNGPRQYLCQKDKMVGQIQQSTKTYRMVGKYLTVDFGEHLGFEAHDQVRPLLPSQVRLTCTGGKIKVKVGNDIQIEGGEE